MLSAAQLHALIEGILAADNATKQRLGQRFAAHLGFDPGPSGADDGIDGSLEVGGTKVHFHFQCKLQKEKLGTEEACEYWAHLDCHRVKVSIILAGRGFKNTFDKRLRRQSGYGNVRIHKLTLADLLLKTAVFQAAIADLPTLKGLHEIMIGHDG